MDSEEINTKWFAVTAGLLPVNFEESAARVENNLLGIFPFTKILKFNSRDLAECAPQTLAKYGEYLREDIPGYGYYSWKSEIVQRTINGEFGECDGVMWVDGGCEVFNSPWTRNKLRNQIQKAEKDGYLVFELNTPEYRFSKSDVISFFPQVSEGDTSPQVQATHFFLFGDTGRRIANNWFNVGLNGIHMFDHSPSKKGDPSDFVLHKSDQSTFSLTMKSLGLRKRISPPPAGNRGLLSRLGAIRAPIWAARNRSGKSLKGPLIKFLERIFK
jgi:hypothetical protein